MKDGRLERMLGLKDGRHERTEWARGRKPKNQECTKVKHGQERHGNKTTSVTGIRQYYGMQGATNYACTRVGRYSTLIWSYFFALVWSLSLAITGT